MTTHLAFIGVLSVLLIATISVTAFSTPHNQESKEEVAAVITPEATTTDSRLTSDHAKTVFNDIAITGESAIVVDLISGEVLFERNADTIRPLASVTKLMTALVASERLPKEAHVAITQADLLPDGESMLVPGDRWSLMELLSFTLITSSNDGARVLANAAGAVINTEHATSTDTENVESFVEAMNDKARLLNLANSTFRNDSGLDISPSISGADGTARDVAMLLGHIVSMNPSILEATSKPTDTFASDSGRAYAADNTNTEIAHIPGLFASKTGYTDLAGGNLAVVVNMDVNRPVAIVVLGSTPTARFADTEALSEASRAYFRLRYP